MPGGDGSGPMGMGPMTGRAAGFCAGYPTPGFMNPGYGRSFGGGFGRGLGLGFRGGRGRGGFRGFPAQFGAPLTPYAGTYGYGTAPTREQELDSLKGQAEYLEDTLDGIKKRIAEIQAS